MEVPTAICNTALGHPNVFMPTRVGPVNPESHLPYYPGEFEYSSLANLRSRTAMDTTPLRPSETYIKSIVPPPPGSSPSSRNATLELRKSHRLPATTSGYFSKILSKTNTDTISNTKSFLKSCYTVVTDVKSPSTNTTNNTTMSWYCSCDGILDLFKGLNLTDVEQPVHLPDVSLFEVVSDQAPNLPRHILRWGESENKDIIIWSIQESSASHSASKIRIAIPTKRRRGMRGQICRLMADLASGKGHERELAKSFEVVKVKEEAREAVWHLVRRTKVNPDIVTKEPKAWVTTVSTE
ncbi:hypothetical protein B0J13DRAFT_672993 [Dactylonectria estremocensis]|uniref:Uncharacterized protein n=1 Tax=Dactylonectria estremocensis TaxID=1079267 RepID=A0A9P9J5I4_9HYPO|nr:hypothetical protein B0J13DRAFT_672993 [Dactylonectria estremocensis]